MPINLTKPDITELKPRIIVFGVGGAGGNAVNNMITSGLNGVDFVVANTDAQALTMSSAERVIQLGEQITEGLGAGSQPDVGRAAAEECIDEINDHLSGSHMVFITAGMGGGTGTGAAPVIARAAREQGILTVGVVTKPFQFEGSRRMVVAESGIEHLQDAVDTLIVIPNQNLFRVANERTTFADAFAMADEVLYSGVACITDLMVKEGLINLDFADVRAVMRGMGRAMMGTGEASGEERAIQAAAAAIANPLLDETSMRGARGLLISITGGQDLTLYEVDAAATRISDEVDPECNVILGATFDESLDGIVRVSVVATGIPHQAGGQHATTSAAEDTFSALTQRLRQAATDELELAAPAAEVRGLIETDVVEPHAAEAVSEFVEDVPPRAVETICADEEMTISRMPAPRPMEFAPEPEPEPEIPTETAFIPPVAAQPAESLPKMPHIDEFPMPAREVYEQHQRALSGEEPGQGEKRPNLFERLAQVGLGRRDAEEGGHQKRTVPNFEPRDVAPELPGAMREFAKPPRPAKHQPQVANAPRRPQAVEEDQYEIPAFLRRQSNG